MSDQENNETFNKVIKKVKDIKKRTIDDMTDIRDEDQPTEKVSSTSKFRRFEIIIDEQGGPDASSIVQLGVNGVAYQIMRGHKVIVPEGVVNVLSEAITAKIVKNPDGTEQVKHMPRISFRVLREIE